MAWFETNFVPCEPLAKEIQLVAKGRPAEPIATINSTPITETPLADLKGLLEHDGSARYVAIHGMDRYCAYPIHLTEFFHRSTLAPSTAYGTRTGMETQRLGVLPPGVLIDPTGTTYAPAANGKDWFVVGGQEETQDHLTAVREMAASVYRYEQTAFRASRTTNNDRLPMDQLPPRSDEEAMEAIDIFIGWLQNHPDGERTLADQLQGRIDYSTAAPVHPGAPIEYHVGRDRLVSYPPFIAGINGGAFLAVQSRVEHELAHQASHDRETIRPVRELVWAGITVYGQTIACRYLDACKGGSDLPLLEKIRLRDALAGGDPIEEALARTAEQVAAERWTLAIQATMEQTADRERRRMLTNIPRRGLPVEILRLGRTYYVDGLRTVLDPLADAAAIAHYTADYDAYLACAEGDLARCPAPYRIKDD